MCGRYTLQTPLPDLAEIFGADVSMADPGPRFNIAPTETVVTLRGFEDGRKLTGLRWGLIPSWSRGPADLPLMINARSESLKAKPAFRDLLADRRCAVLADGFFEWRTERWGETESCAIVTTGADPLLLPLHDRMPVVLSGDELTAWVDPGERTEKRVREVLGACPPDLLEALPVTPRVNRVGEDDAECVVGLDTPIRRLEGWEDRPTAGSAAPGDQLDLF